MKRLRDNIKNIIFSFLCVCACTCFSLLGGSVKAEAIAPDASLQSPYAVYFDGVDINYPNGYPAGNLSSAVSYCYEKMAEVCYINANKDADFSGEIPTQMKVNVNFKNYDITSSGVKVSYGSKLHIEGGASFTGSSTDMFTLHEFAELKIDSTAEFINTDDSSSSIIIYGAKANTKIDVYHATLVGSGDGIVAVEKSNINLEYVTIDVSCRGINVSDNASESFVNLSYVDIDTHEYEAVRVSADNTSFQMSMSDLSSTLHNTLFSSGANNFLTLYSGTVTSVFDIAIINCGKLNITGDVEVKSTNGYAIYNAENGVVRIVSNEALIESEASNALVSQSSFTETDSVTIEGGTIKAPKGHAVYNGTSGSVLVNGGVIEGATQIIEDKEYSGIYNESTGNIKVTGGTIKGWYGIYNKASGNIQITGGNFDGHKAAIFNGTNTTDKGSLSIVGTEDSKVTIKADRDSGGSMGIRNKSSGLLFVDGGNNVSINGFIGIHNYGGLYYLNVGSIGATSHPSIINANIDAKTYAIANSGSDIVRVTGGEVKSESGYALYMVTGSTGNVIVEDGELTSAKSAIMNQSSALITISGGTISGDEVGVENASIGTVILNGGQIISKGVGIKNLSTGSIEVIDGTIVAANEAAEAVAYGIYNVEIGKVTVGLKDSASSKYNAPIVRGKTHAIYTPKVGLEGFYNGTLWVEGTNYLNSGGNATKEMSDNEKIDVTDGTYRVYGYANMDDVFTYLCGETCTITLVSDQHSSDAITLGENANITVKLNGKTWDINDKTITTSGTLTILGNGKITGSGTNLVSVEKGTVTLDDEAKVISTTTSTNSSIIVVKNGAKLLLANATLSGAVYGIDNAGGTVQIDKTTIENVSYGVNNRGSTSKLIINGGTIDAKVKKYLNVDGATVTDVTAVESEDDDKKFNIMDYIVEISIVVLVAIIVLVMVSKRKGKSRETF